MKLALPELFFWGVFGLTIEVIFTALKGLILEKKFNLMGHTSLWMFPIYAFGLTYGIELLKEVLPHDTIRYLTYPLIIWLVEIAVGYPTSKLGVRIWDYGYLPKKLHWNRIISYIHYPFWVGFGIIVERVHQYAG